MGLIYASADSSQLITALKTNISNAKQTTNQLKSGSQKVVSAVDGRTLAGAAYTAGKGLFSELIIPTIARVTTAFDQLEQELNTYQSADSVIRGEGSYLDEEILKKKIEAKKAQKRAALASVSTLTNQIKLAKSPEMSSYIRSTQKEMNRLADSLDDEIRQLEKKIEVLYTFSSSTKSLFSNSLNELKMAMQGVVVLSKTIVTDNGSYVLPKGTDKSWFKEPKFYPSSNSNNKDMAKVLDDFLKGLSAGEFGKEAIAGFLEKTKDKIISEGKNIGKSWAAKLQPRSTLGTFVKDPFKPRKWLTSNLRKVSKSTSNVIGQGAKWAGRGLIALGAWQNGKDFYDEHHNVGRAISYSAVSTTAGYGLGALVGVGLATVGAPVALGFVSSVVVGAAISTGVKYAYNNFKPLKVGVDFVGDGINSIGKGIKNSFKSLKGTFSI